MQPHPSTGLVNLRSGHLSHPGHLYVVHSSRWHGSKTTSVAYTWFGSLQHLGTVNVQINNGFRQRRLSKKSRFAESGKLLLQRRQSVLAATAGHFSDPISAHSPALISAQPSLHNAHTTRLWCISNGSRIRALVFRLIRSAQFVHTGLRKSVGAFLILFSAFLIRTFVVGLLALSWEFYSINIFHSHLMWPKLLIPIAINAMKNRHCVLCIFSKWRER